MKIKFVPLMLLTAAVTLITQDILVRVEYAIRIIMILVAVSVQNALQALIVGSQTIRVLFCLFVPNVVLVLDM